MPRNTENNNKERLFALDAGLRTEADNMLKESGLGEIIREEGYHAVGSYSMKTMTWRDLDFEREVEGCNWRQHWELGIKLAKLNWVWSAHAVNAYTDPRNTDLGYYWGLRAVCPGEKDYWKLDLWTAKPGEFAKGAANRPIWESRLNDDTRYEILVIKEAVCMLPEYRNTMLSVHIYEAVLEKGIRGVDEFMEWWKKNYGK
jgi:hypothetical protein